MAGLCPCEENWERTKEEFRGRWGQWNETDLQGAVAPGHLVAELEELVHTVFQRTAILSKGEENVFRGDG